MNRSLPLLQRAAGGLHHSSPLARAVVLPRFSSNAQFLKRNVPVALRVKQQIRCSSKIPGPLGQSRSPPPPPPIEEEKQDDGDEAHTYLGTTKRLPEFNLIDKVILVSGAARGLGLVQAEALLEAGAIVTGIDMRKSIVYALDRLPEPSPKFFEVQKRATRELGTSLHYRQIDVRDVPDLNSVVEAIADQHGRIDGLIAAAGVQQETSALEYSAEDANMLLSINVTGVFMTAQAVARQMLRFPPQGESEIGKKGSRGSIVLIGSMSATVANRSLECPAYNASKGAVVQLARNLAMEWGPHGIRVNTISPGYIVTDMVTMLFESQPEREALWSSHSMLGRLSSPREYRGAAVFLMSDASSFMTGSDLRIDGGHCAW